MSEGAIEFAQQAGMSFTVADVLHRRGLTPGDSLARWLDPKLADLTPPHEMADLATACERIERAILSKEQIVVFGDYDCDGITSTAIMTEVIEALGGEVAPLLASRFTGGYGFSEPALAGVLALKPSLLITCDCGSSDHERLEQARLAGLDSIVIDHHLVPPEPLPVLAFLNPHRPECGFPYKGMASCGLALMVAAALRKRLGKALDVRRWLDLVAVGTIADVAPLDGDNRRLVRAGLKVLAEGARPGLAALVRKGCGTRKRPLSAEDVAFQVAPRLNAPGRLGDPTLALQALMAREPKSAQEFASEIEDLTLKRRAVQAEMLVEALADVESGGYQDDPCLVLARQGWHPGVVGIVAGRLADQFQRPAIVVALDGATGTGSARAVEGYRLHDSLTLCASVLERFGGHQAAAGVEVQQDKVGAFRDLWREACAEQRAQLPAMKSPLQAEVRLDSRDDLLQVLSDLEQLEPCGEGNAAPRLLFDDVEVRSARALKEHLKLEISVAGKVLSAFGPRLGEHAASVMGKRLSLVGRLKRDHWRGGRLPEILVESFV